MFWICNGDLEIRTLLIPLEAKEVLSHHHLYRMNGRLVHLPKLGLEKRFEAFAIRSLERDWSGHVEVVKEVCDVEKDGMSILLKESTMPQKVQDAELTSVTPKSLIVVFPPCSVPSSASICWKHSVSRFSSKSPKGGRSHC